MRCAHSTTAVRRDGCSGIPYGLWCAGVRSTAGTSRWSSSATTAPCSSRPIGAVEIPIAASASRKMNSPYASTAIGRWSPNTRPISSTACRTPAQMTIESGDVRTPRARARYSASASRSSGRPRGSPMRSASVGALVSARRVAAAHSLRGNSATSGLPGSRLWVGHDAHPPRACGQLGTAGVDHPGARALPRRQPALGDQLGVGLGDGVAGQSEVGRQRPRRRQHGARRQPTGPHRVTQRGEQQFPGPAGTGGDGLAKIEVEVTAAGIGPRIHGEIQPCRWVFAH